jgi:hypothetical protein
MSLWRQQFVPAQSLFAKKIVLSQAYSAFAICSRMSLVLLKKLILKEEKNRHIFKNEKGENS